ncbi:macrophage mannose receptor 1-like isoform X2 [Misgurnus anguillicaudatus]|uniref:macrophage mannose receptor 1-like isoform X2 n=1 Tax=Misgurnus anguillicaudatus TaxID=75329 RepID=UPI003CCF1A4D
MFNPLEMAQTLYFSLLLIALCSLSECIQRRYHYINISMNWTEAQSYCRKNYTDLATVDNMNDMKQLMSEVNNSRDIGVWIGLTNTGVYKWKWSMGDTVNYTNWETSIRANGNCAYMINGKWRDLNYGNQGFICYNDKLVLINQNLSWSDALSYCRQNHVDLVSVDSEKIQRRVSGLVQKASTPEVWLGLRHSCALGVWFWMNGQMVCYQNWVNSTADKSCDTVRSGAVQSGGDQRWISLPQTELRNFICIKSEK